MSDFERAIAEPKQISGWACLAIGVGFVAGLAGLIIAVLMLAG
jgi:hypothetical protein